jgi:hypothetical protein
MQVCTELGDEEWEGPGKPYWGLRVEPEGRLVGSRSIVEVAGVVGGLVSVGLAGRKREGRDRAVVTATGVRGDPRRTVLQSIMSF